MNVTLIIADTLRADHLGCYGNPWIRTPTLDHLATESIVFTRAYPEVLPTIPVRRTLHTGRRTFPCRDWFPRKGDTVRVPGWQPIPEEEVTLAEILQHEGYRTALITDVFHMFKPSMNFHRGFDEWRWIRGQERDRYRSAPPEVDVDRYLNPAMRGSRAEIILREHLANTRDRRHEEDWAAPQVFREGIRWLEENRDAERFFLVLDVFDPHEPWDPPQWYRDLYYPNYTGREMIMPMYGEADYLSPDELRYMRACYAAEVTMVDRWLGHFMGALRDLGRLEDTAVIFVSDHGHQLGEHGLVGKVPRGLYPELMHVPFLLRHPEGLGAGRRVDAFVQHHDLPPTILGLLGVQPPLPMDGIDLTPLVRGQDRRTREYVTCIFRDYVWTMDREFALIARRDGGDMHLFDLAKDPEQRLDVVDAHGDLARTLWERIVADAAGEIPDYTHLLSPKPGAWYQI
ncbi:MAG: sulfatase [Armatimonadota bacterium]|nr:sulfatase [Armatimonadota bacterium]MDR7468847.1 sulfatase [Armatimonadota bacterium]MDR7475411.1 sulfatase [Armatimonadota bacterium]MDR7540186.1 sulfatase [Armatimonadota bacterium]